MNDWLWITDFHWFPNVRTFTTLWICCLFQAPELEFFLAGLWCIERGLWLLSKGFSNPVPTKVLLLHRKIGALASFLLFLARTKLHLSCLKCHVCQRLNSICVFACLLLSIPENRQIAFPLRSEGNCIIAWLHALIVQTTSHDFDIKTVEQTIK